MKKALRIVFLSLKTRIRSMSPWTWIIGALGCIGIPVLVFHVVKTISYASPTPQYLLPVVTGVLNYLLLIQVGTTLGTAFYYLYLSRDLPLLMASPLPPRAVILAKMLEVAGAGIGAYLIVGIPMIVALGCAWFAPPWYYALSILAGLPFAILPAVVAVLMNLIVCRLIPPYKSTEVAAALGTLASGLSYLLIRVTTHALSQGDYTATLTGAFTKFSASWSPAALLAAAIVEGLWERPFPLVAVGGGISLASIAVFGAAARATERAYLSGWASTGTVRHKSRLAGNARAADSRRLEKAPRDLPFSVEIRSLAVESKLVLRDLQSHSQMLYVLLMMIGLVVFPSRGSGAELSWAASWSPFLFLAMAGSYSSWSLRNASLTARLLRQTPCNPARVMRGKAMFYGIVQALCVLVFAATLAVLRRLEMSHVGTMAFVLATLCFSTAATSVCVAAFDPGVSQPTGPPRLGFAGGFLLFLSNVILSVTGSIAYMWVVNCPAHMKAEAWFALFVFAGIQAGVFFGATNMAGNRIRGIGPPTGSAAVFVLILGAGLIMGLVPASRVYGSPGPAPIPSVSDCSFHSVNGVSVYFRKSSDASLSQVAGLMLAGIGDEREDEAHCAHMAEHMAIMYPTRSRESLWSIAAKDWSIGSIPPINGYTGLDFTTFIMAVPSDDLSRALATLVDGLFRSTLTSDAYYRTEIKRARRELDFMTTNETSAMLNKMRITGLAGTPYATEMFESPLAAVPAEKVRGFMDREYSPRRLSLVIVTDRDEAEIVGILEESLEGLDRGAPQADRRDVKPAPPSTATLEIPSLDKPRVGIVLSIGGVPREDFETVARLVNIVTRRLTGSAAGLRFESAQHSLDYCQCGVLATYGYSSYRQSDDGTIDAQGDNIADELRDIIAALAEDGPYLGDLEPFRLPGARLPSIPMGPLPYDRAGAVLVNLVQETLGYPVTQIEEVQDKPDPGHQGEPEDSGESSTDTPDTETILARLKTAAQRYFPEVHVSVVYVRENPPNLSPWLTASLAVLALAALAARKLLKRRHPAA